MLGASDDTAVPVVRSVAARRRRVLMPLLVVTVVGVVAVLLAGRGQLSTLIGAGSTLAQPLIERAAVAFADSQVAADPQAQPTSGGDWVVDGTGIEYEPVGSLGGVMRLADPEVDFAVTDYPLSATALEQVGGAQFPVAVGALAIVHSTPVPDLRLDAATLAQIYLGAVTRWDDPALAALNPDAVLPDLAITVVHRGDGSGSTHGVTRYLSGGSAAWAEGPGTGSTVEWPTGTAVERSGGMVEAVQRTDGAIGYVEHGQASRAGLSIALVGNAGGGFTTPSTEGMQAAVAGVDFSGDDGYTAGLPESTDPAAYPLTVGIYAVLRTDPRYHADTARTLGFLSFVIGEYDSAATDLGYLPLPSEAADQITRYQRETFAAAV